MNLNVSMEITKYGDINHTFERGKDWVRNLGRALVEYRLIWRMHSRAMPALLIGAGVLMAF